MRRWIGELLDAGLAPRMEIHDNGTEHEWITRLAPDLNTYSGVGRPIRTYAPTASGRGRPPSTLSSYTPIIIFRVSAVQRAELEAEAVRLGISPSAVAKRRAFPAG